MSDSTLDANGRKWWPLVYPLVVGPALISEKTDAGTAAPYQGWFIGNPNNHTVIVRQRFLPWWVHALAVFGLAIVLPYWPDGVK